MKVRCWKKATIQLGYCLDKPRLPSIPDGVGSKNLQSTNDRIKREKRVEDVRREWRRERHLFHSFAIDCVASWVAWIDNYQSSMRTKCEDVVSLY
jgi:hypothetical protein